MQPSTQPTTQPSGQPTTRPNAGAHGHGLHLDPGAIAGIVIGVVAALGIAIGGYQYHKKRQAAQTAALYAEQEKGFDQEDTNNPLQPGPLHHHTMAA